MAVHWFGDDGYAHLIVVSLVGLVLIPQHTTPQSASSPPHLLLSPPVTESNDRDRLVPFSSKLAFGVGQFAEG